MLLMFFTAKEMKKTFIFLNYSNNQGGSFLHNETIVLVKKK